MTPGRDDPAPAARGSRCPRREPPAGIAGEARLRRGDPARAQPGPRPPRHQRLRARRPGRRTPGLRLRDPGGRRADVDHRATRTSMAADPTKVGVAISDVVDRAVRRPWGSSPGSWLAAADGPVRGPARRRLAPGIDPGRARQPGAERLRHRVDARAGSATPTRTSSRTRRSPPADGEIAVAVGSERQWPRFCAAIGLPELADDPRFATNGDRVDEPRRRCGRSSPSASRHGPTADVARGARARPTSRAAPINDVLAAFDVARGDRPSACSSRSSTRPSACCARSASRSSSRRPRRTIRTPPPLLGEHTDEILAELGIRPATRSRACARCGVV